MKKIITSETIESVKNGIENLREGIIEFCKDNKDKMVSFRREEKDGDTDPMYCYYRESNDDVIVTTDGLWFDNYVTRVSESDVLAIAESIAENNVEDKIWIKN